MTPVAVRRRDVPMRSPNADEILHALLECGHVEAVCTDGAAVIVWRVPAPLFETLLAWGGDEREAEDAA